MGYLHTKKLTTPLLSFGFYFFWLDSAGSSGWSVPCSVDLATLYWSQPPPALTRLKTGISLVWVISGELLAHLNNQYIYNSIYLRIPIVDSTCCWKLFSATLNSCNFLGFSPENNQDCPWQWCHQKPGRQEKTNPALPAHLFISQINQQQRSHPTSSKSKNFWQMAQYHQKNSVIQEEFHPSWSIPDMFLQVCPSGTSKAPVPVISNWPVSTEQESEKTMETQKGKSNWDDLKAYRL